MAKKQTPEYTVKSRIGDFARDSKLRVSGDFADALNEKVHAELESAARRAKDNGRSTLRPSDL